MYVKWEHGGIYFMSSERWKAGGGYNFIEQM